MHRRLPQPTLFPYTTLFRSFGSVVKRDKWDDTMDTGRKGRTEDARPPQDKVPLNGFGKHDWGEAVERHLVDRKSTRLNSSHRTISYAVFCLKKKNFICVNVW